MGPGDRHAPCAGGRWGLWGCASTPSEDGALGQALVGEVGDGGRGERGRTPEGTAAVRRLEAGELWGAQEGARAPQGGGGGRTGF